MESSSLAVTIALALAAGLGAAAYVITTYNQAQRWAQMIPEVASNIEVLLRKRRDLIGRLLEVVGSYGLHEKSIASGVAGEFGASRRTASSAASIERLASLRMEFPQLRADSLYTALMDQLSEVETEISRRRERYNATVRAYNTLLTQFPKNIVLLPFSFQPRAFLVDLEQP
jgi:LemA protein